MSVGLKSVKKWIKRCDKDCKVRQAGNGLKGAIGIAKCDKVECKV